MKTLIAAVALIASTQAFAFIDENGKVDGNNSMESMAKGNAEGRGVATFSMNFSASANSKGDFVADGMGQNIFGSENRPYYYSK